MKMTNNIVNKSSKNKFFGSLTSFRRSKKGITWSFIVKIIIWLIALGVLIFVIAKVGQSSGGIIQKIKDILGMG